MTLVFFVFRNLTVFLKISKMYCKYVVLALLFMTSALVVFGQSPRVVSYGLEAGIGRADVRCIYQDSRGILWVGTSGAGLYTFNLERFSQRAGADEVGYRIRQIGEDEKGYLYVLSERGLFRYDGRSYEMVSQSENDISCFAITGAGVWWAEYDSVFLNRPDNRTLSMALSSEYLVPQCPGPCGVLALSSRRITVVDHRFRIRETTDLRDGGEWVSHTKAVPSDTWIVSKEGRLVHDDGFEYTQRNTGLLHVNDIEAGALGSLWIGSQAGVSVYQPSDSLLLVLPVSTAVNCVYFDKFNRLWLGSPEEGLIRYFGEQHRVHRLPAPGQVEIMLNGGNTPDVYQVTAGQLISLTDPENIIEAPEGEGTIRQYYKDVNYRLWGLSGGNLWMMHDTSWTLMDSTMSATHWIAGSDKSGNLWISNGPKLLRYRFEPASVGVGVRFLSSEIAGELPADKPVAFFSGSRGEILRIGTNSLGKIGDDNYELLRKFTFNVLSADLDSSIVWFGTEATGLYLIDVDAKEQPQPVHTTYPLRAMDIHFIRKAGQHLVLGTDRSLLRLSTDTSNSRIIRVEILDQGAGINLTRAGADDYVMTGDGHVLVNTGMEIIEFDLSQEMIHDVAPSISVSSVLLNGIDIDDTHYTDMLGPFFVQKRISEFVSTENGIAFSFSVNSIEDEVMLFQWRLSGLDTTWSDPSPIAEVQFSGLRPGKYALEARVCDASGNCGALLQPWQFTIRKALWQQLWFLGLMAVIAGTIGWWWYRSRRDRQRIEDAREKRRLEAELNALTLEQKTMQLQMNPHFIFNALQSVRSHIREDKLEDARTSLTRFAKLMRTMLDMSRSETITMEDELDFLRAYVDVEKLMHHLPIHFTLTIDDDVEPYDVTIPPMLFQPILENAIKYGGNGEEIRVDMTIRREDEFLHFSIEDNGKGFGSHVPIHKSAALEILKNRIARISDKSGFTLGKSELGGAKVEFRIPCNA